MKGKVFLFIAVIMIIVGGIIANLVQNNFYQVKVRDVRFATADGSIMSGLLFIPKNATPKTPAPGILAVHGYINSRETQSGFAIEFARRGWVVLEIDQSGHGYTAPPAFANGFGGPAGLAYLRSLDFVDKNKIGMEGHSMGGWAILAAAMARPDDYKALVLEGSSTGAPFAAEGSTTYPKNMALVEGTFDEFSLLMWSVPVAANVVNSDKLKKVFGVTETIEPGKIYGSIEGGTARILYQPVTTHPGEHLSPTAIGYAIDWFQKTLGEEKTLAPSNQIWFWKEIATLIGLIGCILLVFAAGNLLLQTGYFSSLQGAPQNPNPASGVAWWVAAILMIIIGPLTYFPATRFAYDKFKESWLFPQKITNDIVLWLLVVTIISVILFVIWHLLNKKKGGNAVSYGLKAAKGSTWKKIGLSAWFAFLVTAVAYLSVMVISYFFTVDFRFWIMPIKPMSATQFKIAFHYIIPLALFYLMFAVVLHGQLRSPTSSFKKRMLMSAILGSLGYLIMLVVMYIPILAGGVAPFINTIYQTLFLIVAVQLFPLFFIVSLISTYFSEKTGLVYVGAFVNAFFITWYMVAAQATHIALC